MNNLSLKHLTLILVALLLGVVLVISSGISYLSWQNHEVERSWAAFQAEYSEKARLKNSLNSILGYGGMIHKFKNLILRKDRNKLEEVISHLGAAYVALDKYENLVVNDSELAAISDIRETLKKYWAATKKVDEAILQNLDPREIDSSVRIDDRIAIRGLKILRNENIRFQESIGSGFNKALHLGKVRTFLGYGGMIHAFKNYILRGELEYKRAAEQALFATETAIGEYKKSVTISQSEKLALNDILIMINKYQEGLEKAEQFIYQGKNIDQLDALVKVDDVRAIRGLNIIDREVNRQIDLHANEVQFAFTKIQYTNQIILSVVLGSILIIMVMSVWVIVKRIAKPIKQMSDVMILLAEGNVNIQSLSFSGKNEIGKMAKAIEVFKDNAVKRIEAEKSLQSANNELNQQLAELRIMRQHSDEQTEKALNLAEGLALARDEALTASYREEAEKERLKAIVDTVSDGIITIDENGLIHTFNPAAELVFGYKESDVVNSKINMLMPSPFAEEHDAYINHYIETGVGNIIGSSGMMAKRREVVGKRKDGTLVPLELSIGVNTLSGEKMFTGIVRDISKQKEMDQLKRNFVSSVSHELRTPLTAIKGSIGLIASEKIGLDLNEQASSLINITQRNIERLSNLINDLLDFEKLESDSLDFVLAPAKVSEILHDAVTVNQHFAINNDIRFTIDEDIDALVNVDVQRINQVMANLLSNAAKFSPKEGVVSIGAKRIRGSILIYVTDKGLGIPEEFHKKIFDRFTQVDSSSQRKQGGTGLGMAISKAIIEKHDGKISFHSVLGKGSTFYFELPEYKKAAKAS